uniref:LIM domain only 4b n=1 Tax=Myripristis murdjan TaxID=586833 RepID=A0A667WS00_9TELE
MVNPGGSTQPPPVGAGSLSWKRCAGCGGKIADRFLLYTMDSYWHSRCLKCSCCQAQLGEIGTSCYTKSGMILCRNDYIRLFGNSGACSACGQSIPASELVMRAQGNVYHLKCFTCSTCRNRLVPGDRFHYINGSLFCEHDRPTALINGHLSSLQTNPLLPDQKVRATRQCGKPSLPPSVKNDWSSFPRHWWRALRSSLWSHFKVLKGSDHNFRERDSHGKLVISQRELLAGKKPCNFHANIFHSVYIDVIDSSLLQGMQ